MSEIEVTDVEEAKIMLSMKNDQIKSLNNKMKMIEKKANIKLAESNYQIQQLKNKIQDADKKKQKEKEIQRMELTKFSQAQDKLKVQISKLKQTIGEMQKNQRQMERAHKASFYEYDLKLNEQKQQKFQLMKEIKDIMKLFNPKQIMKTLNLKSFAEITPYLKIHEQLKFKCEQATALTRQLEQYKTQTLHAMEESFSKLNSYQEVMQSLRVKNTELQQIMIEKQKAIEQKHYQLQEKDNMLAQVEAFTTQKYHQMSTQIQNLRRSVQNYERQSLNYNQSKQQHENNLKFIFELSAEFQKKQQDYLNKINQLEISFQTMECQKQQMIKEYHQSLYKFQQEEENFKRIMERLEKGVKDKEDIIQMLTNSLRDLETEYEHTKNQLEKNKLQTGQLIRRKHKLQEQLKEKQAFYMAKEQSLLEEVQILRNYQHNRRSVDSIDEAAENLGVSNGGSNSLQAELEQSPQPNWFQLYEATLQKHNKFIREVYFLLRKQERKQSAQIDDTGF